MTEPEKRPLAAFFDANMTGRNTPTPDEMSSTKRAATCSPMSYSPSWAVHGSATPSGQCQCVPEDLEEADISYAHESCRLDLVTSTWEE